MGAVALLTQEDLHQISLAVARGEANEDQVLAAISQAIWDCDVRLRLAERDQQIEIQRQNLELLCDRWKKDIVALAEAEALLEAKKIPDDWRPSSGACGRCGKFQVFYKVNPERQPVYVIHRCINCFQTWYT